MFIGVSLYDFCIITVLPLGLAAGRSGSGSVPFGRVGPGVATSVEIIAVSLTLRPAAVSSASRLVVPFAVSSALVSVRTTLVRTTFVASVAVLAATVVVVTVAVRFSASVAVSAVVTVTFTASTRVWPAVASAVPAALVAVAVAAVPTSTSTWWVCSWVAVASTRPSIGTSVSASVASVSASVASVSSVASSVASSEPTSSRRVRVGPCELHNQAVLVGVGKCLAVEFQRLFTVLGVLVLDKGVLFAVVGSGRRDIKTD